MSAYRQMSAEVLADAWGTLTRYTFKLRRRDGAWDTQIREVYDRGHGAVCLLHDPVRDTVLLVRQFRLPMQVTGQDPYVIEAPAGLLDGAEPAQRMRAELREETGFEVSDLRHRGDIVMSPGSVSERLAFFTGTYAPADRRDAGGGAADEGEDIEVLEPTLPEALAMVSDGRIRDAKTIILLQMLALDP